jgi:arsenite methyltransferase
MSTSTAKIIESYPVVEAIEVETKVKAMYRDVANNPDGEFHFEMGREMAERLGYESKDLDQIPRNSIDSFAGVGYYFDFADIQKGEEVIDLGSGSGMDTFVASLKVGEEGYVTGVDMTEEQLQKADSLRKLHGIENVSYIKSYIQATKFIDNRFDVVISNGVINLAVDKGEVFKEAARILKKGGRLAIADIVSEKQLPEDVTCNSRLWAACIGGAMLQKDYISAIESAGFEIKEVRDNSTYKFISGGGQWGMDNYGVKSISILAVKK